MLLLLLLLAPDLAFAEKPTAVVLGVGGYQGKAVRNAIIGELDRVVTLVPMDDVMAAADTIDANVNTPEGLMRVAESMALDLFVRGRVEGKKKRAKVEITVVGPDGRTLGTATGKSPASKKNRAKLAKQTAELVQSAVDLMEADAPREPVEGEEVLDEALGEEKREVISSPPPPAKPVQVDLQTPEPEVEPERAGRLLSARAGVAVRARKAQVKLSDGRLAVHDTGPFPEIALRLEGRPYAGLYAMADFGIELGLSSIERTEQIGTDALHASGTVGYLMRFGILDIGGGVGFGIDRFALGQNRVMDSTLYSYVRVAAIAELTLFEALMIELDLALRPVVSTGELGDRYGQSANALGFEAAATIAHETDAGFVYGISGQYAGYTLRFRKTDHLSATDGFDGVFSVALTIGWVINRQP